MRRIDCAAVNKSAIFPIPSLNEQNSIVAFLDRKLPEIDRFIANKRRLIELLEEQHVALIGKTTMRGVAASRYIDSGVDWLGEIPAGWKTQYLKRLIIDGRGITYGIVQPGDQDPTGKFMIRGGDYSGEWCTPDKIFRVSDAIEIPYKRSRVATGDIVITIVGAGVGNIGVVPKWLNGSNITQTSARIAIDPSKANSSFIAYALRGTIGRRNLERYVYGAAQPRLNIAHVDAYIATVPPLPEQAKIVAFLDEATNKMRRVRERAEAEINLTKEFRVSLITEAVTGKIDVRSKT